MGAGSVRRPEEGDAFCRGAGLPTGAALPGRDGGAAVKTAFFRGAEGAPREGVCGSGTGGAAEKGTRPRLGAEFPPPEARTRRHGRR